MFSRGVGSPLHNRLSDQDQRQTVRPELSESGCDGRIGGKSLWLLGQIVAFNLDAVSLDPFEIAGKLRQHRVNGGAAYAG